MVYLKKVIQKLQSMNELNISEGTVSIKLQPNNPTDNEK